MITRMGRGLALLWRTFRDAVLVILFASLLATLIGQIFADRWSSLSGLMYMPAALIAPAALCADLLRRGRVLRGPRFQLSIIALISIALELPHQVGLHFFDKRDEAKPSLRVVQWNVMWGGDWQKGARWPLTVQTIVDQEPDIVVLTEVPFDEEKLERLRERLGDGWAMVGHDYMSRQIAYWSRMRLISRYPVHREYVKSIASATVAVMRVDAPSPLRILLVDGVSGPSDKSQMLALINSIVSEDGRIDLICGDFNAISRSEGFAPLRKRGYRNAASRGLCWRGSWPSVLPIYDIDHVLVSPSLRIVGAHGFSDFGTDHRGRVVDVQPAG